MSHDVEIGNIGPSTDKEAVGYNGETISITNYKQKVTAGESTKVAFSAYIPRAKEADDTTANFDSQLRPDGAEPDVDLTIYAFIATDPVELVETEFGSDENGGGKLSQAIPSATLNQEDLSEDTNVNGELSLTFKEEYEDTFTDFWLLAEFDYHNETGFYIETRFAKYKAWTESKTVEVVEPEQEPTQTVQLTDEDISPIDYDTPERKPLQNAYNRSEFKFFDIQFEEDAVVTDIFGGGERETINGEPVYQIDFEYASNPNMSIDTGGRFVKHEIVGGPVVRQKVGEEPDNYSITGVCYERTAQKIDALKNARFGKIASERIPGKRGQPVQFASASTEPIAEGGGVDIASEGAKFLYTFDVNAIEIQRNIQENR